MPWYVVGLIHAMESGQHFGTHLHNGDPLTAPTVHVPRHRPRPTGGPFTFVESAVDALRLDGLDKVQRWSVERVLYQLELFNGTGYRRDHPECLTPYLWSGTQHYHSGKYVEDHEFDAQEVSEQIGAAAILRAAIDIEPDILPGGEPVPADAVGPAEPASLSADSYRKAPPEDPPIDSMADSTIGNIALGVKAGSWAVAGNEVSNAIGTANTPAGFDWAAFATHLLSSQTFMLSIVTAIGMAAIWLERRRHKNAGHF